MWNNKMKIVAIVFAMLLCACTQSFEDELFKNISSQLTNTSDVFKMEDVYGDWDEMYVFLECSSRDDIEHIIGKTNHIHDLSCDVVFLKKGKIVRYEEIFTYEEGWLYGSKSTFVRFDFNNDSCYMKFDKESAIFKVEQYKNGYILFPSRPKD